MTNEQMKEKTDALRRQIGRNVYPSLAIDPGLRDILLLLLNRIEVLEQKEADRESYEAEQRERQDG